LAPPAPRRIDQLRRWRRAVGPASAGDAWPTAWPHPTACVYYYDPNKTALLLEAVRPLFDELSGLGTPAYFERHWLRGAHLRLRFAGVGARFEEIRRRTEETVSAFLERAPSRFAIDPADQLRQHRRLASLEGVSEPLTPLEEDNTLVFEVERESRDPAKAQCLREFYLATNGLVFGDLKEIAGGFSSIYDLAIDLMIVAGQHFYRSPSEPSLRESLVSFRSHADAFIANTPRPDAVRAHFQSQSRLLRAVVSERIRRLETWSADERHLLAFARPLEIGTEQLASLDPSIVFGDRGLEWSETWLVNSSLHATIAASPSYRRFMFESAWFLRYRISLNLTYLHLSRLGLLPVERYMLCQLVADAAEEVYSVSALELVRAFAARHGAPPDA
jgi:hypothetical protein